jgi:hypothetical protein
MAMDKAGGHERGRIADMDSVQIAYNSETMKLLIALLLWLLLAVVYWPAAVAALLLFPVVWLLLLPLRLIAALIKGVLHFIEAMLLLPARLLGGGGRRLRV